MDDPLLRANGFHLDLNQQDGEMRIAFVAKEDDQIKTLSVMILDAPSALDLSKRILRGYDILEGIQ